MSEAQKKKGIPPEQRAKMQRLAAEALKNKPRIVPQEVRDKISASLKGRFKGENNPSFGKKKSEESIQKMKETKRKNPQVYTEERKAKLSASLRDMHKRLKAKKIIINWQ